MNHLSSKIINEIFLGFSLFLSIPQVLLSSCWTFLHSRHAVSSQVSMPCRMPLPNPTFYGGKCFAASQLSHGGAQAAGRAATAARAASVNLHQRAALARPSLPCV